jgi:hypothetical protein
MQYDGLRFRAECKIAGKLYGQPFGVDVAFGDPMLGEPEAVVAEDVLAFAGIPPPTLRLYPIETHIAEKLHAYTMPRARPNSRVKDLPDLALLATAQTIEAKRLRAALEQTFTFRKTHSLPVMLPDPLPAWETPFAAMAREYQLAWPTLDEVTKAAKAFLDPVLAGDLEAVWRACFRSSGISSASGRRTHRSRGMRSICSRELKGSGRRSSRSSGSSVAFRASFRTAPESTRSEGDRDRDDVRESSPWGRPRTRPAGPSSFGWVRARRAARSHAA